MKKMFFMLLAVLFTAQTYGQKYDFLTLLNSFPPVPDNVLASNKDEEIYRDKLMKIFEQVSEYQRALKNMEKKETTLEEKEITLEEMEIRSEEYNKMEPELKEKESIYDNHIGPALGTMVDKWGNLQNECTKEFLSLDRANEPYYEQIRTLNSKPRNAENEQLKINLQKKIYATKLELYPRLYKIMSDQYKEMLSEFKTMAPYVKKYDEPSLNTIKMKPGGLGLDLLQTYLRVLESAFDFKLGPFEENVKGDWEPRHYWAPDKNFKMDPNTY